MNTEIQGSADQTSFGILSLTLSVSGVILAVLIGFVAHLMHHDARMGAYFVFVAFEIAALATGVIARKQPLGRAGAITSGVLLLLSLAFL